MYQLLPTATYCVNCFDVFHSIWEYLIWFLQKGKTNIKGSSSSNFSPRKKSHVPNQITKTISNIKVKQQKFLQILIVKGTCRDMNSFLVTSKIPFFFFSFFFFDKMAFINSTLSVQFWSRFSFVGNEIAPPTNLKSVRMMLET